MIGLARRLALISYLGLSLLGPFQAHADELAQVEVATEIDGENSDPALLGPEKVLRFLVRFLNERSNAFEWVLPCMTEFAIPTTFRGDMPTTLEVLLKYGLNPSLAIMDPNSSAQDSPMWVDLMTVASSLDMVVAMKCLLKYKAQATANAVDVCSSAGAALILHRAGADIHQKDANKNTVLSRVIFRKNPVDVVALLEFFPKLLEEKKDANKHLILALATASDEDAEDTSLIVNALLKHGASLDSAIVVFAGDEQLLDWLLANGADFKKPGLLVQVLEKYKYKPELEEIDRFVMNLLARGAQISDDKDVLLKKAVEYNLLRLAGQLILAKANINGVYDEPEFRSPSLLMASILYESFAVFSALLDAGADCNQEDSDGLKAIHYACFADAPSEFMTKLLDSGADINCLTKRGSSPLIVAAGYNNLAVAKLLLERGADTSLRVSDGPNIGKRALELAKSERMRELIQKYINN